MLWLVAAFAFGVSSVAVLTRHTWWLPVTICVTAFSLVLCVIGWPDARIGLFVDIAILAVLLLGLRSPAFLHLFGL